VLADDDEAIAAARTYADRIRPGAAARDGRAERPWREVRELAATGLLGITVPRGHGGAAVRRRTVAEVFRIISAAGGAIGQIPQNHFVFGEAVARDGTPEQQDLFFGEVLRGALFGNALSEKGTRGGVAGMRTRLRPDPLGDGFRLDGQKAYCTGALYARWIPVMCLDEDHRLHVAYVERDAPGVEVIDDWTAMGQRATASGTTVLRDVAVPALHVVPHWRTYEGPQTFGSFGQLMHGAVDVGIAEDALADALDFVRTRTRPFADSGLERAADEPHLIKRVGELWVRLDAARALLGAAADAIDRAEAGPRTADGRVDADAATAATVAVAGAKAFASEVAVEIADELFALAGTAATDEHLHLDPHWRNARTHTLHDPARWKYHHLGNWALNGVRPPNHGLL
jgi:SfnB family sulfur acquisition oxidoreductase